MVTKDMVCIYVHMCINIHEILLIAVLMYVLIIVVPDYIQSVYGGVLRNPPEPGMWPPSPVLQAYVWWCDTVDPLLGHNPLW